MSNIFVFWYTLNIFPIIIIIRENRWKKANHTHTTDNCYDIVISNIISNNDIRINSNETGITECQHYMMRWGERKDGVDGDNMADADF